MKRVAGMLASTLGLILTLPLLANSADIPFQVLIDRQGIVRKIHAGFDPELETVLGLKELAGLAAAGGK